MPVTASYTPNVSVGNGVTTVFPYTFRILDADDLLVQLDGVSTTSGYTVSGVGDSGGGNVTFSVAPTSGVEVLRARNVPYDRETDYQHNGDLLEETLDADFDRTTMQIQQLAVDVQRGALLPLGHALAGLISLPLPGAGKFLRWNAAGTDLEAADAVYDNGSYLASGAGAVERTVDSKLGELVTPMDYGAEGDGVTDDTDAWQAAIDSGAPVIDGRGRTYKVTETLTWRSDLDIINAVFDFSDAASGDVLFYAEGALGSPVSLTANRSRYSLSVPLTSGTGFAAGDHIWLISDATYETNASTKQGEICLVQGVSGATLTLRDQTHAEYNTADSARVRKFTFVENLTLRNVRAIGAGDGTTAGGQDQYAVRFAFCRNVRIENCQFERFDYSGMDFATCLDVVVDGCAVSRAYDSTDGASYGITFTHGSQHGRVSNCRFDDTRHGVAIGGTNAVNRYIDVGNCTMQGQRAGGLDSHEGGELVSFHNNIISNGVGSLGSGSQNGIQFSGGTCSIIGNIIRGTYESAIAVQQWSKVAPQCVIADNLIENSDGAGAANIGILYERRHTTAAAAVTITGNSIYSDVTAGIIVDAETGPIEHLTVANNAIRQSDTRGIYLIAQGSNTIQYFAITGNTSRVTGGGNENILLSGAGAASIILGTITGNVCHEGTYGIRGVNTNRIMTAGNVAVGASVSSIAMAGADSVTGDNVVA